MRSRRALINFISSFGRNFIATVLSLAATPLILNALGEERFGAFRILLDWLSHLSILEFGLYSASLTLLSKAQTEGPKSLHSTIRLIFKNYFWILLLQILSFSLFIAFINHLIPVSESLQRELQLTAMVMSASLLFILSQIFKSYLEAVQKGYLVSFVLVIFNGTYLAQSTLFATWQWGLLGQALAYITSLFLSLILLVVFAPEILRYIFQSATSHHPQKLLKSQRTSHFINELCGRVSLMSDNIIVSLFMGAGPVTAFYITQKAGNMMQQQLQHISNSSWAALSELHYQGHQKVFNQRVLNLTELVAFSSGVLLSVVCVLNPAFVKLWTGEQTFSGLTVSNLTAINAGLFSILSLWSWCFAATNLTEKIVTMSIVQSVVNLTASFILTSHWGVVGPLYGNIIGYVGVSLFWKSKVLSQTFQIPYFLLLRKSLVPFVPPMLLSIFCVFSFGAPQLENWWQLFAAGALCTIFIFLTCYLTLISKETKTLVQELLRKITKKFRS